MALIICTWSGGIDSTALIALALRKQHQVLAISLGIYGGAFAARERAARQALRPRLHDMGDISFVEANADWIWAFSPDRAEIPRRNRHIIDHLIMAYAIPNKATDIGLGEYIGADTWVVRDHVGAADADARALAAYVYAEYDLGFRLWTLSDFGEARYKTDRLALGLSAGIDMSLTTNCLRDRPVHCGRCYKCIERHAAFSELGVPDLTQYETDPADHAAFEVYSMQMHGLAHEGPAVSFDMSEMPGPA